MSSDLLMRMGKTKLRYCPFIYVADYEELSESNKSAERGLNLVYHTCDEQERIT